MKTIQKILIGLFALTFCSCSTGYISEKDAVYYEAWNEGTGNYNRKIDADPKTFLVLKFNTYAKDEKSVFYKGEKIIGADAKTFEALGEYYAKDKNFGWYGKDTIPTSNGQTFKVINSDYSTDGHDVFYATAPLKMEEPKNFKFVAGEDDIDTWTTDGKYYYYNNYKVPSDDYKNLIIYPKSGGLSKDKHWVYFLDHKLNYDIDGKKVVDTIDIATFEVTGFINCRDKYGCFNVYHGRDKCKD
jgi:hypothetical protein